MNFNKHVLIDLFLFKHEMIIKEELINSVDKKLQSGQIVSLPCSVIIQLHNCDVYDHNNVVTRCQIEALVIFRMILCNKIKYRDSSFQNFKPLWKSSS